MSGADENLSSGPRVGVNLLWMLPGQVGGSEQATMRQLGALGELADAARYHLFCTSEVTRAHPEVVGAFETTELEVVAHSRLRRIVAESTSLERAARQAGIHLMHHPGGTVPVRTSYPSVVTIHDIQPLDLPAYTSAVKGRYLAWSLPRAVRAARRVAVPSEFVRRRVIDRLDASPDRVTVIPLGPPRAAELGGGVDGAVSGAEATIGLDHPPVDGEYLLYPAVTWPHKGHLALLDVMAALPDEVHLVLTGGAGPAHQDVVAAIETLGLAARVRHLGRVSQARLGQLYRAALAVVVPSEYEGFGMPVIEAEAAGAPVIASDHPGLDEACGGAALRVSPGDVAGWVAAVQSVRTDTHRRDDLIAAGLRVAATFDWTDSARALVDLHRAAWETP